jgi:predicted DNA binding protein
MSGQGIASRDLLATSAKGGAYGPFVLVEVLVAYSHSAQASELHLCRQEAFASRRPKGRPVTKRGWSLSDRLTEAQRLAIVNAYRSGATAARLAATHDLSLSSLKRILRSAKAAKIYI